MLDVLLSVLETEKEKTLIAKLYTRYELQMYSVAYSIIKRKQEAEDIVQNVFLKIIENLPDLYFDTDEHTQALLTIMTRSLSFNALKKQKRCIENEADIESIEELPAPYDPDIFDKEKIRNIIDILPVGLKHTVILRNILGYSADETAKLLDITVSAVYKRIDAAKKIIKKYMEDNYD